MARTKTTPKREHTLKRMRRQALKSRAARAQILGDRIAKALDFVECYGGIDGGHHKQWVLDQMVRALSENYGAWVEAYQGEEVDEDGNTERPWDEGCPP